MDPTLYQKIESVFGSLVVDKTHALQAGFDQMPRFVTEFLLAAARGKNERMGITDVRERIRKFSVDADRKGEFISRLMREGQARLIALLEVEPRPERNEHIGRIAQIDGHELSIGDDIVSACPELLYGGLWGTCLLRYDLGGNKPRIVVTEFSPYQLTRPDMEAFRRARSQFSLDEWLELLITSAGYRPEAFPTLRKRLLLLARLTPLTQPNLNLIEMGPRGTGKSYLLRSLSARVYLLAGARATPAVLLYDLNKKQVGIVGRKKVVIFDEVGATQFPDRSLVASLKDYMESGQIARGGRNLVADCSFIFAGNIEIDADGQSPHRDYTHLLESLPKDLCDVAIGDRIHGFLPGWEMPKISDGVLADGVGFLSDYFGEVLGELRRDIRFLDHVKRILHLEQATIRDRSAVEKIAAGLLKLLYPDLQFDQEGTRQVLQIAVELRQRVHDQLVKMAPGEFRTKHLCFAGMEPHKAPDLGKEAELAQQDIEVNQRSLVGKITILTVGDKGGGDVGFVECAHVEGSGLSVTGIRGPVMEHSVRAAYDCLLNLGPSLGLPAERLRSRRMTVHLVNIAQPKDGPSAGLAFALAMFSAATRRPVKMALAVTGELSIHGNIGAVGGVIEKLSAAIRHGRQTVLIPAANAAELARIPDAATRLDLHPVSLLDEALMLALDPPCPDG